MRLPCCMFALIATCLLLGCITTRRALPAADSFQLLPPPPGYYTPQTGRLDIVRSNTAPIILCKTDTAEMTINTHDQQQVHLTTGLFQHGLLTPELLSKAINEYKIVDHRGDTIVHSGNINARHIDLLQVEEVRTPKKKDNNKNALTLRIRADFSASRDVRKLSVTEMLKLGSAIFLFELTLNSKSSPDSDLAAFLREATIARLLYTGMEI